MEASEGPVLDPETIAELLDLDDGAGEFLDELIEAYNSDSPMRIAEIERCLGAGDASGMAKAAHALKGSSGNIGAKRLMTAAFQLEKSGKAGNLEGCAAQLASLKAEYGSAKEAFSELRKK